VLSRASVAPTVHRAASGGGVGSSCYFLTCVFWGQAGHNNETCRADDLLSGFGWLRGVMKADNEDNGKALKSLALAK
jgi:hypothetical protein